MDNTEMLKKIAVESFGATTEEEIDKIVKMLIRLLIG